MTKKQMNIYLVLVILITILTINANGKGQSDSGTLNLPKYTIYGSMFGDFIWKVHADAYNRGGTNQYSGEQKNFNMFQFRRIQLGSIFEISKKFEAEILIASEDQFYSGDLLSNGKFAPFIKLASIRWSNLFKGTDFVAGQIYTPAFTGISEDVWGYRSIERTITDRYGTPEFDLGYSFQGHLPNNDNFGYRIMEANGQGARPENNSGKWYYADVYGKFMNKKLIIDFYSDYQRLTWIQSWHRDRQMNKLFIGYTTPKFTVGAEVFYNRIMGDNIAVQKNIRKIDTITTRAFAFSLFARGSLKKDCFGYFVRYDNFDAGLNNNNTIYNEYYNQTSTYNPNVAQQFVTAGIDYSPAKNVHIMPNLWYVNYYNFGGTMYASHNIDYDLVYRITVACKF